MHQAVDSLSCVSTVYPDTWLSQEIPWSPALQWPDCQAQPRQPALNAKQREAVIAITAPSSLALPPILISGPYGTGKTFTLGKAIEALLEDEKNKILICTHSNSAADLYIKEYLHPYLQTNKEANKKLLRVYYHNRYKQ